MRYLFAILMLACTACQPSEEVAPPQSPQAKSEAPRSVDTPQRVHAFGGTVVGTDMGEFGGDVSFIEADGTTYQLIPDNSHGIFNTSDGVFAMTGLAHLGSNRGSVYLLSRQPGKRVAATATLQLPGAPCNDITLSNGKISFRVFVGRSGDAWSYRCFLLQSPSRLIEQQCAPKAQGFDVCFGKPDHEASKGGS